MRDLLQNYPGAAVAALILGFGFLILIHELGHFLVAKWAGIRATQFAIGFGPAIASYRKGIGLRPGSTEAEYEKRARAAAGKDPTEDELYAAADGLGLGETEYRWNWLPLGGYVKMLGQEDMDPTAASQDEKAYNQKPIWKRMAVISAGVVMNLAFGLLFLVLAFGPGAGVSFPAPVVGDVAPGEPAATTFADGHAGDPAYLGLLPGDRILSLNGDPVEDMIAVRIATALGGRENTIHLSVERPGEPVTLGYSLRPRVGRFSDNMLAVGLQPADTEEVAGLAEGSVWADAGLRPGDRLVEIAGEPVEGAAALQRGMARRGTEPVELVFEQPDGARVPVAVRPEPALARDEAGGESLLGLRPLAEVTAVEDDLPAKTVGLMPGDLLARVGRSDWPSQDAVFEAIAASRDRREPLELAVLRGDVRVELPAAELRDGLLGIAFRPALATSRVAAPSGGRADALPVPAGSRIDRVQGAPVNGLRRPAAPVGEGRAGPARTRFGRRRSASAPPSRFGSICPKPRPPSSPPRGGRRPAASPSGRSRSSSPGTGSLERPASASRRPASSSSRPTSRCCGSSRGT